MGNGSRDASRPRSPRRAARRRSVRRRRALVGVVVAAMASVASASSAQTVSITCRSPSLGGTLPAIVYLPPGYHNQSRRYRVIYFLHGLPADPSSYTQNAFVAPELAGSARSEQPRA